MPNSRGFDAAFEDALCQALGQAVALVGLGCGGKDARCLAKLRQSRNCTTCLVMLARR